MYGKEAEGPTKATVSGFSLTVMSEGKARAVTDAEFVYHLKGSTHPHTTVKGLISPFPLKNDASNSVTNAPNEGNKMTDNSTYFAEIK